MSEYALIDIGANLTHESFAHDLPAVLQRARDNGVKAIIVTGADLESSEAAIALSKLHDGLYATIGWHPHYAETFDAHAEKRLHQLYTVPQVKAIGEIGLDFYRNHSTPSSQEKVFETFLDVAAQTQLPVFTHEREAHQRVYEILRDRRDQLPKVVIHCFTGDRDALAAYLDLDLYIGITGWICDERRGTHLKDLVRYVPKDRLMLETDAPYLMPRNLHKTQIHTKQRNEPCYLAHIARTVAQCRNCEVQTLARETYETSKEFFAL